MKRNIFLFTDTFPYGSGETFLKNELVYLAERADKIYIIPLQPANGKREMPENVVVLDPLISFDTKKEKLKLILCGIFNLSPINFAIHEWKINKPFDKIKIWEFITFLLRFRCIYKKLKINFKPTDILYFYWGDKSVMLAPGLKEKYGSQIIVRFHGSDLFEEAKVGYIPFRHYVFPSITKFVSVSECGRQYLILKYPKLVDKQKIFVSRLGVFDRGLNTISASKPTCFHILSCSYLVELKRIELIIKALHLIKFEVQWTHIGDGPLRDSLQAMCVDLPDHIHVIWMGQKDNEEVIRYYQHNHVDFFINVSSSEGIPVSIMEAMSFGVPAMATDVGGVSEIVNNSNGVLLPAKLDDVYLAAKLEEYAHKDNAVLRENARKHWMQYFNADINYRNFAQLLFE